MFKKWAAVAVFMGAGLVHAFAPQSGTWLVSAEANGLPGRGMAVDVQNETFGMQMFAYESDGRATFYTATGPLVDNKVTAVLNKYSGGRFFGSGARTGVEAGTPGSVTLRFTSGTTGFVTFPNEAEVAISRFNFAYGAVPESLRGIWSFNSIGTEGLQSDLVEFTKNLGASTNGNGLMTNASELFGCEHQVRGALTGNVLCVKINASGQLLRSYVLVYSVNEGEGYSQTSGSGAQQMLEVRRITTPKGVGTGLIYKDAEASTPGAAAALLQHLEHLSAVGVAR